MKTPILAFITTFIAATALAQDETLTPPSPQFVSGVCRELCDREFWLTASDDQVATALANVANINVLDGDKQTALHIAAWYGTAKHVEMLLDAGADPNGRFRETGSLPPISRIRPGNQFSFYLFETFASPHYSATQTGYFVDDEIAERLPNAENRAGDIARLLLEHGADIDPIYPEGASAFIRAVYGGNTDLLAAFLTNDQGAQLVEKYGDTALRFAVAGGTVETAKMLFDYGASPLAIDSETGSSLLHRALLYEKETGAIARKYNAFNLYAIPDDILETVNLLLGASVNPNHRDIEGRTAMFDAVSMDRTDIVDALLAAGADPTITTPTDENALFFAAGTKESVQEFIEKFLNAGGDLDHQNVLGFTALHAAALDRNEALAQGLIAAGANIDIRDNYERTPFFIAAKFVEHIDRFPESWLFLKTGPSKYALVDLFAAAGADINTVDDTGASALYYVQEYLTPESSQLRIEQLVALGAVAIPPTEIVCTPQETTIRVRRGSQVFEDTPMFHTPPENRCE